MNSRTLTSHTLTSRNLPSRLQPQFFFDPESDPSGGAPANGENSDPSRNSPNPQIPNVDKVVQKRIAELLGVPAVNSDPFEALALSIKQNHALEQRAEAAEKGLPSRADRELLAAVKALGLNAEQLKAVVTEHGALTEEKAKASRVQSLKDAAAAEGLNADLLASLNGALDVEYVARGEGDEKKGFVKIKGADGAVAEKSLSEWAREMWPALAETLAAPAGGNANNNGGAPAPKITPYGPPAPAGKGKQETVHERIRREMAEKQEAAAKASLPDLSKAGIS